MLGRRISESDPSATPSVQRSSNTSPRVAPKTDDSMTTVYFVAVLLTPSDVPPRVVLLGQYALNLGK
jgi:hypothetical protein